MGHKGMAIIWIIVTVAVCSTHACTVRLNQQLEPCPEDSRREEHVHHGLSGCKQKVVVTAVMACDSNPESISRDHLITINDLYDTTVYDHVRLFRPLVIKVTNQPTTVVYPLKYLGAVNNKPYEAISHYQNVKDYKGCSKNTLMMGACRLPGDTAGTEGRQAMKGFCCSCGSSPENTPYHKRGGQKCMTPDPEDGENTSHYASTHCLRFDPLWYSVYELGEPVLSHMVTVSVYLAQDPAAPDSEQWSWQGLLNDTKPPQKDPKVIGEHTWANLNVPTGITVGTMTSTNGTLDEEEMVWVSYAQQASRVPRLLDPDNQFMLIPQPMHKDSHEKVPIQLSEGAQKYLVVEKEQVSNQAGGECDKIGVLYEAFITQPDKCEQPAQSCLDNQPKDLWQQDQESEVQGEKGRYFLKHYGVPADPPLMEQAKNSSDMLLAFQHKELTISTISVEIDAKVIQVVRRGHVGSLVQLTAVSTPPHTIITVTAFNPGQVSALMEVRVTKCTDLAFTNIPSKSVIIHPGQVDEVIFTVKHRPGDRLDDMISCLVELGSKARPVLAERQLHFHPSDRCFCIAHCQCKCALEQDLSCQPLNASEYLRAGYHQPMLRHPNRGLMSIPTLKEVELVFIVVLALFIVGSCKALAGCTFNSTIGNFGLSCFRDGEGSFHYIEHELRGYKVVYNHNRDPIHPHDGRPVQHLPTWKAAILNVLFIYLIPFLILWWVSSKCLQICFPETYQQQDERSVLTPLLPRTRWSDVMNLTPDSQTLTEGQPGKSRSPSAITKAAGSLEQQFREKKHRLVKAATDQDKSADADFSDTTDVPVADAAAMLNPSQIQKLDNAVNNQTPMFRHFSHPVPQLKNSGYQFCLCGYLTKEGGRYRFSLMDFNHQLQENLGEGRTRLLEEPLPMASDQLEGMLSMEELINLVTIGDKPVFACLNRL